MQKVQGIGGFFFRANQPGELAHWYLEHLGIDLTPTTYGVEPWQQTAGPTVFAPFPLDSDFFGSSENLWMMNFRVDDLDAMIAQLEAADITVKLDPNDYPNGRFAALSDPEGNPIQLWEPKS